MHHDRLNSAAYVTHYPGTYLVVDQAAMLVRDEKGQHFDLDLTNTMMGMRHELPRKNS